MKKFSKHTPEQLVAKLEQADKLKAEGKTNGEVVRELQASEAKLSRWRRTYGSMNRNEAKALKQLREENQKLKALLGEVELENGVAGVGFRETSQPLPAGMTQ